MTSSHITLAGPTAAGKSWLALEVARSRAEFEIVSVDSMQVYRGLDIGTAKPSIDERNEIPHHLIDVVNPDEEWSLAEFQAEALRVIDDIERRGRRALLVGGTGLYLQAITDGLELPGQYPEVRRELEGDMDTAALYSRLASLDPLAASRMEPSNRRRIVRALEVTVGSGRAFSSFGPGIDRFPETRFTMLGIWLPRSAGARRIDDRVDAMVAAGLVDEVSDLRRRGALSRTARQALGYKEILSHLDGLDLALAVDDIKRRTRSFARRQRVWFRRDPRIRWFGTAQDTKALLPAVLRECERT